MVGIGAINLLKWSRVVIGVVTCRKKPYNNVIIVGYEDVFANILVSLNKVINVLNCCVISFEELSEPLLVL